MKFILTYHCILLRSSYLPSPIPVAGSTCSWSSLYVGWAIGPRPPNIRDLQSDCFSDQGGGDREVGSHCSNPIFHWRKVNRAQGAFGTPSNWPTHTLRGVPEEEGGAGTGRLYEEIMTEMFPNLTKDHIKSQETQWIPCRMNPETYSETHYNPSVKSKGQREILESSKKEANCHIRACQ